jgi:hypothetical protein
MVSIPVAVVIFVAGLIAGLISYLWGTQEGKIKKLERKVDGLDVAKCKECDPVTLQQVKDLFDARFNEFRLELYKSGVLKAANRKKTE